MQSRHLRFVAYASLAALCALGCGSAGTKSTEAGAFASAGEEEGIDPEDRPFLEAGRPFFEAIAAMRYADAYALLSSHAKARMSQNQFSPSEDEKEFKASEENPMLDVSEEQFAELMEGVVKEFGQPSRTEGLHVYSRDPAILARKGAEPADAIDSMFAIGAMPDSVPADIRKASLRGQIVTILSDEEMAKAAEQYGYTVEELKKDPDFTPGFTLKVVLVEEEGLKVGYFEFLPPSMFD